MTKTATKKELATLAGYTYRRLYDIDRDLPEDKRLFVLRGDGKYDVAIFVQHWVEYNVNHENEEKIELEAVKAKHEVIKAEKTQIEVDKLRGQLIDVNDVKYLWASIANTVMQNFMHLPSKVAPQILMMDNIDVISSIIEKEVRKILENIADTPLPDYALDVDMEEE